MLRKLRRIFHFHHWAMMPNTIKVLGFTRGYTVYEIAHRCTRCGRVKYVQQLETF